MSYFWPSGMRLHVIVDPTGEDGRFHRRGPRLWQRFHPLIEMEAYRGNHTFGVNRSTYVLHAVADRSLVHIQADVIHRLHGGASFGVSESAGSLSSAFVHQALLHRPIHSNYTSRSKLTGCGERSPMVRRCDAAEDDRREQGNHVTNRAVPPLPKANLNSAASGGKRYDNLLRLWHRFVFGLPVNLNIPSRILHET